MNWKSAEKIAKKILGTIALLLAATVAAAFFLSCGGPAQYSRVLEMPQSAVAHPDFRAGAPVLFINYYQATHAVVYLYRGALQPAEMFANLDGRLVIFKKYIEKLLLERAYSRQDITVKTRLLDVNAAYTVLVIVWWDIMEWAIYPATPQVFSFQTDGNPMAVVWIDPRGYRSVYANRVVEVAGTDEPARGQFVFRKNFYPNQWVWGMINKVEEKISTGS